MAELRKLEAENRYITAEEAVKLGLAHKIIENS